MTTMVVSLRSSATTDFEFCSRLYFAGMAHIIRDLGLDMLKQIASFREQWIAVEVRIIELNGIDVGWLQSRAENDAVFLAQLYLDAAVQNQGIGTVVLGRLFEEAASIGHDVTLGVVKSNPAQRLYKRLGFVTTHEDERKFYMRRDRAL